MISQWVWNLRLELGHQLHPDPVRTTDFAPAIPPTPLPRRAMLPLTWACPGKLVASLDKTLLSNPMGRCGAPLTRSFSRMSSAEKPMEACAWCMEPASAVIAPVLCVSSVNGMGVQPANRRPRECAAASTHGRAGASVLARPEPSVLPTGVYPVNAPAMYQGGSRSSLFRL